MRFLWVFPLALFAAPPKEIPFNLRNEYTLGDIIPVYEWYFDNSYHPDQAIVYDIQQVNSLIFKAKQREVSHYGATDYWLYAYLDQIALSVTGEKIGIIGSVTPWYESIILSYGGHPITIEYNKIINEDPRLEVMTVEEYWKKPQKFEIILCISSIEHDGLGRYGDPINPQGDLDSMWKIKEMLKPDGILILAIPVGQDAIYWNAHRVYGRARLPLLFEGWDLIDSLGFSDSDFSSPGYSGHQPVFVLRPQK